MQKKALMSTSFTLKEFSPHEPTNTLRSSNNTLLTFLKFRPKSRGVQAGDLQLRRFTGPVSGRHAGNIDIFHVLGKQNETQRYSRLKVKCLVSASRCGVTCYCVSNGWKNARFWWI